MGTVKNLHLQVYICDSLIKLSVIVIISKLREWMIWLESDNFIVMNYFIKKKIIKQKEKR